MAVDWMVGWIVGSVPAWRDGWIVGGVWMIGCMAGWWVGLMVL